MEIHIEEIKARAGYLILSNLLCTAIILEYMPTILMYSPYAFMHTRWDEALWSLIVISEIGGFVITSPILMMHLYLFIKPAMHKGKELGGVQWMIVNILAIQSLFWIVAPKIIFKLPAFIDGFQSENQIFIPKISDLSEVIVDFSISSIGLLLIPLAISRGVSRVVIYIFIAMIVTLFLDAIAIAGFLLIPLVVYTEFSFIVYILWKRYMDLRYMHLTTPRRGVHMHART